MSDRLFGMSHRSLMIFISTIVISTILTGSVGAEDVTLEFQLPGTVFLTGSPFQLDIDLINLSQDYSNALLFVALNVGTDDYWFFPSWVQYPPDFDSKIINVPGFTRSSQSIIPLFDWPSGAGTYFNAAFIGAVLSESGELISDVPLIGFGWTDAPLVESLEPVSGPPGKLMKIKGQGFNLTSQNITIDLAGYQFPVTSTGIDADGSEYVITVIPPLESNSYDIRLISDNLISNPVSLVIDEMAPTGKPPGQVIDEMSQGMGAIFSELQANIIPDAVSAGLIPPAAQTDFQATILRASNLFDTFNQELQNLPSDQKAFMESMLVQNGLDEIFSGISSRYEFSNSDDDVAGFYACLGLDTTSACLTAIDQAWSLVDLATIMTAILSGGAGIPVAGGSFGVHYAIIILDSTLDGFFPVDLKEIQVEGVTGPVSAMVDQQTQYKIQGVFDNQKPPLEATFGILLSTFMERFGSFIPENFDDQLRNWVIGKLAAMGISLGDDIMGEDMMNWGDPSSVTFYVAFSAYENVNLNQLLANATMFVNVGPMLALMNYFNMGVFPETGITVGDTSLLDYTLNQETMTVTGRAIGDTTLTFNAFAFNVSDAWWNILGIEIPEAVTRLQEVNVAEQSEPTATPDPATATPTVTSTPTPSGATATPETPTSTPTQGPAPPGFTSISPGTFQMGSPDTELCHYASEAPVHSITLTRGFYLQQTEVTQQQWVDVFGVNPSFFPGMDRPVEQVTWYDACIFCNRLSIEDGLIPSYYADQTHTTVFDGTPPVSDGIVYWDQGANGYRLPTEAEWEYACRAGTTGPYNSGQINTDCGEDPNLDSHAWYKYNSDVGNGRETQPVGTRQGNNWGLKDMHGNVEEMCWDGFLFNYYSSSPSVDPTGPTGQATRVKRGGAYSRGAGSCRSATRNSTGEGAYSSLLGFRVAL